MDTLKTPIDDLKDSGDSIKEEITAQVKEGLTELQQSLESNLTTSIKNILDERLSQVKLSVSRKPRKLDPDKVNEILENIRTKLVTRANG